MSPHTISIGLIGPGVVGGVLLDQLASQIERLSRELKLDLRVRGIMTSKRMHLAERGSAAGALARCVREPTREPAISRGSPSTSMPIICRTPIIIDCSSSSDVAARYPAWLASGIHIVTPNKKANSADLEFYARLHEARRAGQRALSVRSDRRRGPADHPDAARSARYRR